MEVNIGMKPYIPFTEMGAGGVTPRNHIRQYVVSRRKKCWIAGAVVPRLDEPPIEMVRLVPCSFGRYAYRRDDDSRVCSRRWVDRGRHWVLEQSGLNN
jgi:hypothetical protein